jgi:hypothetical protein
MRPRTPRQPPAGFIARRGIHRAPRRRLFGRGGDRGGELGASTVELVILAPALIFLSMLIIQFALWLDATHAALAAAQEGDRTARETEFTNSAWQQTATQDAMSYYHGLDTGVLANVSVSNVDYNQATNTVSLTVSGTLSGVFPLRISETVTGPVECLRSTTSQGVNCATNVAG